MQGLEENTIFSSVNSACIETFQEVDSRSTHIALSCREDQNARSVLKVELGSDHSPIPSLHTKLCIDLITRPACDRC